ncbi:MAG: transglutaminase domain-containing protein [Oscillibacter sp.]|nr:transglutaminase domain-containing protein [Oscillibacter sp.]
MTLMIGALMGWASKEVTPEEVFVEQLRMEYAVIEDEAVALSEAPEAPAAILLVEPSGKLVKKTGKAIIDYSNTNDGYVMVQYTAKTSKRLKVQVKGPATTYTYNLTAGKWETFPLSDGNGAYQISLFENVSGSKYALVQSISHTVTLKDEFAPFLRPNQYVDYSAASAVVAKAGELTEGMIDPMKKVAAVYDFVVGNLTYDTEKAAAVQSGYLPVLDSVLEAKKGICFDYASLMTGMLRSQGVPCKLVVGYAGNAYHAWINVWSEESGWINGAIFFDGKTWQRMDPTFASSAKQSKSIMAYIGDGKNYTAKYLY